MITLFEGFRKSWKCRKPYPYSKLEEIPLKTRIHLLFIDLEEYYKTTEIRFSHDDLKKIVFNEIMKIPMKQLSDASFTSLLRNKNDIKKVALVLCDNDSDEKRWDMKNKNGMGWAQIVAEENIEGVGDSARKRVQRAVERYRVRAKGGLEILDELAGQLLESYQNSPALLENNSQTKNKIKRTRKK